jgi:hypothetical protein
VEPDHDVEWWSLKKAAAEAGYRTETIRQWAVKERVRSRLIAVGGRSYRQVVASDVRREVANNQGSGMQRSSTPAPAPARTSLAGEPGYLRDRVASLEEVARRYRHIDALRDEIVSLQEQIIRHHREIEIILQGPSMVPDDSGG